MIVTLRRWRPSPRLVILLFTFLMAQLNYALDVAAQNYAFDGHIWGSITPLEAATDDFADRLTQSIAVARLRGVLPRDRDPITSFYRSREYDSKLNKTFNSKKEKSGIPSPHTTRFAADIAPSYVADWSQWLAILAENGLQYPFPWDPAHVEPSPNTALFDARVGSENRLPRQLYRDQVAHLAAIGAALGRSEDGSRIKGLTSFFPTEVPQSEIEARQIIASFHSTMSPILLSEEAVRVDFEKLWRDVKEGHFVSPTGSSTRTFDSKIMYPITSSTDTLLLPTMSGLKGEDIMFSAEVQSRRNLNRLVEMRITLLVRARAAAVLEATQQAQLRASALARAREETQKLVERQLEEARRREIGNQNRERRAADEQRLHQIGIERERRTGERLEELRDREEDQRKEQKMLSEPRRSQIEEPEDDDMEFDLRPD